MIDDTDLITHGCRYQFWHCAVAATLQSRTLALISLVAAAMWCELAKQESYAPALMIPFYVLAPSGLPVILVHN